MLRSYSSSLGVIPVVALILACAPTLRGAVPFEPPHELTVGSAPLGIAVGDLDGDGKADLVLGANEDHRVVVYPNLSIAGALTFGAPIVVGTGLYPQGIAIRDLDGDGKDEVITADSGREVNTGTVSILHNTSVPGTIALVRSLALPLNTAHRVVSVDFDGDSRSDIAATANSNGIVALFRNSGSGGTLAFTPAGTLVGGPPLQPLAAADLDGDSRPEVIIPMPTAAMMRVFPNTSSAGSISFGPGIDFAMPVKPHGIAVADMNQDGKPDLIVANESGTVSAFANESSGPGSISLGPRLDVVAHAGIREIAVGDLDGDGRPDVATASSSANLIVVLRNVSANGQIALAIDQELPAGPSPFVTVSSDIDADGANDVLVSNYGGLTASVFRNATTAVAPFVLDNFNRADGELGANWTGFSDSLHYLISAETGLALYGGPIYWSQGNGFGVAQEAFVTFTAVGAAGGLDNGLLLKVQSDPVPANPSDDPDWIKGTIGVSYDAVAHKVYVSTWRPSSTKWKNYARQPLVMADGDVFGARALANGIIEVHRNGTLAATFTLSATDQAFFNGRGGRIGLWFEQAATAEFDDFGGRTLAP